MLNELTIIFKKEVLDGFRDKRSALTAILFVPIGIPVLIAFILNFAIKVQAPKTDELLEVEFAGSEQAVNLIRHIEQRNIQVTKIAGSLEELQQRVELGESEFIVVISENYAESFLVGKPANVKIVFDSSNSTALSKVHRLRAALYAYNQKIAGQRLAVRGVTQLTLSPLAIENIDMATPGGRVYMILGSIPYLLLLIMLLGGMHLANDMNAGERERGSLEPLLILPVTRTSIVAGKCLASLLFMYIALAVAVVALSYSLAAVNFEDFGLTNTAFSLAVALQCTLVVIPFGLFAAVMFNLVASLAKSYKETQAYLSIALMIPVLPIMFIPLFSLDISVKLMLVPGLSQGLLLNAIIRGKQLAMDMVLISGLATLFFAALLFVFLKLRYHQESIIG